MRRLRATQTMTPWLTVVAALSLAAGPLGAVPRQDEPAIAVPVEEPSEPGPLSFVVAHRVELRHSRRHDRDPLQPGRLHS